MSAKAQIVNLSSSPSLRFPLYLYCSLLQAGAILTDTLSDAQIVLGIKEPPLDDIPSHSSEQIHFMFSHTAKGQRYNTPLLERFIKDPQADSSKKYRRLIDYELLTGGDGKRTIGFGYHAGGSKSLSQIFFNTNGSCYAHL